MKEHGGVAKLEYDFGRTTLTSVTGYESGEIYSVGDVDGGVVYDFDIFRFPAETADEIPSLDQFTQEIRLSSNDWDRFNFQTGFFYFTGDLGRTAGQEIKRITLQENFLLMQIFFSGLTGHSMRDYHIILKKRLCMKLKMVVLLRVGA